MLIQTSSRHYSLEMLNDGVYVAYARNGGAAMCNAGLIDLGDSIIAIDAFATPSAAEDFRKDAQKLFSRVPNKVILTHHHNDHIWGSQAFLPEADFISTIQIRLLIQTAGKEEYDYYHSVADERLKKFLAEKAVDNSRPGGIAEADRERLDLLTGFFSGLVHDFPRLQVILPNLLFENRMVLYGTKRRVELTAFTDAHTGSDIVVYLPDDSILFMSDLLFVGHHGYLGDGNPDRWREVLISILDGTAGIQNVERFVPGHGPLGTRADLQRMADYIRDCQKIARNLVMQDTDGQVESSPVIIPNRYAGWSMPVFFQANMRFLIKQFQQNEAGLEVVPKEMASNSFRP